MPRKDGTPTKQEEKQAAALRMLYDWQRIAARNMGNDELIANARHLVSTVENWPHEKPMGTDWAERYNMALALCDECDTRGIVL